MTAIDTSPPTKIEQKPAANTIETAVYSLVVDEAISMFQKSKKDAARFKEIMDEE